MLCFLSRLTTAGGPFHICLEAVDRYERKWRGVTSGGSVTSRYAICQVLCVTSGRSFTSCCAICLALCVTSGGSFTSRYMICLVLSAGAPAELR